jgi:hypothetical protein
MADSELNSNSDLQATHRIIQFLEEAKAQSEVIIDSLSGFLAIFDSKGVLYRCNLNLAKYFKINFERSARLEMEKILGPKYWAKIREQMEIAKLNPTQGTDF